MQEARYKVKGSFFLILGVISGSFLAGSSEPFKLVIGVFSLAIAGLGVWYLSRAEKIAWGYQKIYLAHKEK